MVKIVKLMLCWFFNHNFFEKEIGEKKSDYISDILQILFKYFKRTFQVQATFFGDSLK